jgi:hypothetical protein
MRPWTSLLRTSAAILNELNASLRYFLLALNADTPIQAQQAADAGQRYLDRATELAGPLGDLLSVWWEDIDNPIDLVQGLITRVEETTGITDPLELDDHGALELKTLLGSDFVCPPGLGLGALVLVLTSRLLFDEVEYSRVAQEAFIAFRPRPERLREVASDPQLRADLTQATDSVMSGSLIASTVAAANLPDHAHLTVALDLARSIVEGPGKRLVAALLAVDGRRPYGTWRSKDISALLPAAKGGRLRPAVGDLELSLRHAAAHQDFRLDGDRIVLGESHNPEWISAPELLERLLADAESTYAVYLALLAAAAEQEIDLTDSRGLRVLGLAGGEAVAVTLRLFGWEVTDARLRGHRLEIEAKIDPDSRLMTALAAAVTGLREEEVTEVEAALELPDRRVRKLAGPMGPWRRFMEAVGEDAKIAANVLIYATWTLDGQALIDRPMIRYASTHRYRM